MYKSIATVAVLGLLAACSSNDMSSSPSGQNDQQGQGINRSSVDASNNSNSSINNSNSSTANPMSTNVSDQDRQFVHDAAIGGMTEVQEGKIAQQQGNSDQVRQLGEHMVADHTKANDELKHLASSKSISVPSDLDSSHQTAIDDLKKLNGAGFDQKYLTGEVKDHQDTIKLFQTEAQQGQDGEIKAFATRTLPTLQHHLQMFQDADQSMRSNMSGSGMSNNPNMDNNNPGISKRPNPNATGNQNPGDSNTSGNTNTNGQTPGSNGNTNGQ